MLQRLLDALRRERPIFNMTLRDDQTEEVIGRYQVMDSGRILPRRRKFLSKKLRTYEAKMGSNHGSEFLRDLHFGWSTDKIINPKDRMEEPTRKNFGSGKFFLYSPFLDANIPNFRHKPEYAKAS